MVGNYGYHATFLCVCVCVLCVRVSTHQCLSMSVSVLISCVFEIRPRCYTFCSSDPRKQTLLPPSIPLSLAFLLPLLLLIHPSLISLSLHSRVNVCSSVIFFQQSILKHKMHGILHCTVTSLPCLHTLAC